MINHHFKTILMALIMSAASVSCFQDNNKSSNPSLTDPDSTDPDSTDPDSTDPDSTDPDSTDPDSTDPDSTDPNNSNCHIPLDNPDNNELLEIEIMDDNIAWSPPGGNATINFSEESPFLTIIKELDAKEIGSVSQGRELFIAEWTPAPGRRALLDGLGPLFNAPACTSCHIDNGRVAPLKQNGIIDRSFLFRLGNPLGQEHPILGGQLQTQAIAGEAEGTITWHKNSDNTLTFTSNPDLSSEGFNLGPRIAPHLLGMGLLDLVTESTILEYEDPNDKDCDGISGRAHWVVEESETRIGRFGWKAINSTLRTQNAGAMHQDMGLTSSVNAIENCTESQFICIEEESGGYPEVTEASLMAIVNFMTALSVPERRINHFTTFNNGSKIFEAIGCASCHRPTLTTGDSPKFQKLGHQIIYPYTDLLLHDMGENLTDGVKEKDASAYEWRTPPLWGIGIVEQQEGARFLHDGRAKTIEEAIEAHDGEAKRARNQFIRLNQEQKNELLEFLRSI